MKKKYCLLFIAILTALLFHSCGKESSSVNDTVIIGIASDIESLDPLNSLSITEGSITELLYLSLFQQKWNEAESKLDTEPMLAESWQWNKDSTSLTISLRKDVYWSDGKQLTADDVIYSFDIYSDPRVQTRLFGTFNFFFLKEDLSIDINKSFNRLENFKLTMNFVRGSVPDLYKIDFSIIPRHIYEKVNRENYISSSASIKPVTSGPYRFVKWDKDQSVVLKANKKSFLYTPRSIKELVFKVVPDYNSRIAQLKKGEIDMMEDIRPEDIKSIRQEEHLQIVPLKGREYEYIGWNNIDPEKFNKNGTLAPHKLFGSAVVRKALTMLINRKEILDENLYKYGELSKGPVSPIFKNIVDTTFKPYDYNPIEAVSLLNKEGWYDRDGDGILEKGNTKFQFTLYIPGGNPRRSYAAVVIKSYLKDYGIDAEVSTLEMGTFIDQMFSKKMDAWIISWFVPVPVELKTYWYSDLDATPMNAISYRNKSIDIILNSLEMKLPNLRRTKLYHEFQQVMHNDQPVTFLYWVDNITAYNKKIKNMNISPLGFIHRCWEWQAGE